MPDDGGPSLFPLNVCLLNAPVTVDSAIPSDNMSGNNRDHNGERLSQNGDNESLYLHDLKNVV